MEKAKALGHNDIDKIIADIENSDLDENTKEYRISFILFGESNRLISDMGQALARGVEKSIFAMLDSEPKTGVGSEI